MTGRHLPPLVLRALSSASFEDEEQLHDRQSRRLAKRLTGSLRLPRFRAPRRSTKFPLLDAPLKVSTTCAARCLVHQRSAHSSTRHRTRSCQRETTSAPKSVRHFLPRRHRRHPSSRSIHHSTEETTDCAPQRNHGSIENTKPWRRGIGRDLAYRRLIRCPPQSTRHKKA